MSRLMRIRVGNVELEGELNESPTAKAIFEALPIQAAGNRWGEEIYFEIPVDEELASDATESVNVGELGYWPPGRAFCIFFGPTPSSTGPEPRAASPVNRVGRVVGDISSLKDAPDGAQVRLEKA